MEMFGQVSLKVKAIVFPAIVFFFTKGERISEQLVVKNNENIDIIM
ncbi:hypothetical protein [Paenibacillus terreus]